MKKVLLFFLAFQLFLAGTLFAQDVNLNEAVTRSARSIEGALSRGTMVALFNFASPSEAFSDYVIEELTGELVLSRYLTIVDRANLTLIRQEMNLQLSGDVSDESAQAIGKMLGAQFIISGNLSKKSA
jgi:TolB-like protein